MILYVLIIAAAIFNSKVEGCEGGWESFESKNVTYCYRPLRSSGDFEDRMEACEEIHAQIATIHTEEENAFLTKFSTSFGMVFGHPWLGLRRNNISSQSWTWLDNTDLDFTNWKEDGNGELNLTKLS